MTADDLIQLMRLSGTGKVRSYLERTAIVAKEHSLGGAFAKAFLTQLQSMFTECQRTDDSDAWPSPPKMKSFGPPRNHIAGRDYTVAIRGALLTGKTIDKYVALGYYGEARRRELITSRPRRNKRSPSGLSLALKLLQ